MSNYASNLIAVADAEVGYLEKKTNAQLDDKTANAGSKNYTKYARDLDAIGFFYGKKQGFPWCAVFVAWCFVQAFGAEGAKVLLNQPEVNNYGAACKYAAGYLDKLGRFYTSDPQPGDLIFFGSASSVTHTGLVYQVDGSKVYTIEGNTSGASGVVANGGGVCRKSYSLTYAKIYGYGRPAYDEEPADPKDVFIRAVQTACGAAVDGEAGPETLSKTVTISATVNRSHAVVAAVQAYLYALGYEEVGKADGTAGAKFTATVAHYQEDHGCTPTGIMEEWGKTWQTMLGMV